jgi:hypothetical protein
VVILRLTLRIGYGGHYGPAFVTYFDEQNAKIDAGLLQAEKVVVSALMINKSVLVLFHYWSISDHCLIAVDGSTLYSNTGYVLCSLDKWLEVSVTVQSYIDFAADAPGYGPLVNSSVIKQLNETWLSPAGCLAEEQACYAAGTGNASNAICLKADNDCVRFLTLVNDRCCHADTRPAVHPNILANHRQPRRRRPAPELICTVPSRVLSQLPRPARCQS